LTVQFILPEATSFPKERKLHDRLFLVLLYNLLCKTFKDHSSTFAASLRSERNSLLQERCFPIASAKVGHFRIPCKTSPKKNARKFHLHPFCYFIAWQNRQLSPFFRFIPSLLFLLQNRPFSSDSAGLGAKSTFFGVFSSSAHEIFFPKISFCTEKISLTGCFCLEFAPISTFAGEEKEKASVFSSNHRLSYIKMGKGYVEIRKPRTKSKRTSWKNKKRRTKHIRASQKRPSTSKQEKLFSPLPHSTRKIQADFLSKHLHFSRLPPLFLSKPPYPA